MNLQLCELLELARRAEYSKDPLLADEIRKWALENVIQFGLSETIGHTELRHINDQSYLQHRKKLHAYKLAEGLIDCFEWREEETFHGILRHGKIHVVGKRPKALDEAAT